MRLKQWDAYNIPKIHQICDFQRLGCSTSHEPTAGWPWQELVATPATTKHVVILEKHVAKKTSMITSSRVCFFRNTHVDITQNTRVIEYNSTILMFGGFVVFSLANHITSHHPC